MQSLCWSDPGICAETFLSFSKPKSVSVTYFLLSSWDEKVLEMLSHLTKNCLDWQGKETPYKYVIDATFIIWCLTMELLFRNPFHKYKDMVLNKIYSPTSRHTDPLLEQPDHSSVLFPRLVHRLCYPTTGTMRVPFRQIASKLLKEKSSKGRFLCWRQPSDLMSLALW